ncbi:MtnX-like HAD-IB family phosphatase [uncultured Bosea sp.]|uniref:MtnX-like HAD-IB family phosphatase n=1 Tax=uncultured Bosea sp. TaxID=211457 RepID=UPI0025F6E8A8|nr:MtnX-like HAD-IB family phosphatase [uncultured Bosea sp.]
MQMQWQAIVDFDGTISLADTTDRILARFAEPGWEAIEEDWVAGRIGSRECMERQIALLHVSPDVLDTFVESFEIDWGFVAFVRTCMRHGVPVTVVSDGLDRTIRTLLRRAGLTELPVIANHIEPIGGDRWRLTSPHAARDGSCASGTCKCGVARSLGRPATILVGDGRSDFCIAERADLVFAKNGLVAHCVQAGVEHHAFSQLADAARLLEEMLTGVVPAVASHHLKDKIDG